MRSIFSAHICSCYRLILCHQSTDVDDRHMDGHPAWLYDSVGDGQLNNNSQESENLSLFKFYFERNCYRFMPILGVHLVKLLLTDMIVVVFSDLYDEKTGTKTHLWWRKSGKINIKDLITNQLRFMQWASSYYLSQVFFLLLAYWVFLFGWPSPTES